MADFEIDGVEIPRPHVWNTKVHIMTRDSKRLPATGKLVAPYLCAVPETTWEWKRLTQEEFDIIYNAYIKATVMNKNIEHTVKTLDSNTGRVITYKAYTEDNFEAALYRVKDGKRIYHNVKITLVGVGGDDSWMN